MSKESPANVAEWRSYQGEAECARRPVASFPSGFIPQKYLERLEHDQKLASCCRHPEKHDIEALKSNPAEQGPDIYVLWCGCGRGHVRFCMGFGDVRPVWK